MLYNLTSMCVTVNMKWDRLVKLKRKARRDSETESEIQGL